MNHLRGTRKQKRSLNRYHQLARRSLHISNRSTRRFISTPRAVIVGLVATVGISSLAIAAAIQHDSQVKSQLTNSASSSEPDTESQHVNNTSTADITVDAFSHSDSPSAATPIPDANTQVTINNESIPVNNGTIHRTYSDENGSTTVDISIDSNSSSNSNSGSPSTRIDIDSSSRSTSDTDIRVHGSP